MVFTNIYENNISIAIKVKKRNNTQILQDNIDDCANRMDVFKKQKFTKDNEQQLQDMIWNATNITGTLQEIIDKLEAEMEN